MSAAPILMPRFKELSATLRKLTEHLARELTEPSAEPPAWSELEWILAQAVAAMQGTAVLLANRLRWAGPPSWQVFLSEQREQAVLRDARIDGLLARLAGAAREAGMSCVALKGSALRALGLYGPGERPMGDIDLLVDAADLPPVAAAIRDLGYREAYEIARHIVYEPRDTSAPQGFGEHINNPIKIEVHTAVAEPLPVRQVDITDCLRDRRGRPGLVAYPSEAALLLHFLLHAAGNMRAHALRQIQIHDIAELSRRFEGADWAELLAQPLGRDRAWWLFPALALAERYYPGSIPRETLKESRAACPRALRYAADRQTLTDVSWANLRIHAFPGIAWSRTPFEALRYVRSRVVPSRAALAEIALAGRAQPQFRQIPWYGLSHGNRMLRWLFSQPPRVQTMLSVRAALENESNRRQELA